SLQPQGLAGLRQAPGVALAELPERGELERCPLDDGRGELDQLEQRHARKEVVDRSSSGARASPADVRVDGKQVAGRSHDLGLVVRLRPAKERDQPVYVRGRVGHRAAPQASSLKTTS